MVFAQVGEYRFFFPLFIHPKVKLFPKPSQDTHTLSNDVLLVLSAPLNPVWLRNKMPMSCYHVEMVPSPSLCPINEPQAQVGLGSETIVGGVLLKIQLREELRWAGFRVILWATLTHTKRWLESLSSWDRLKEESLSCPLSS